MKTSRVFFTTGVLAGLLPLALAQIPALTLDEMVAQTDNAVYAEIVGSKVIAVPHPTEDFDYYFTTLSLNGTSLVDGTPIQVDVTFAGGFVSETEGAHASEAPSADDVKVGTKIVAFYKWEDEFCGVYATNALWTAHGGVYRTVDGPGGTVVLGRGEGYAIDTNRKLASLDQAITSIHESQKR